MFDLKIKKELNAQNQKMSNFLIENAYIEKGKKIGSGGFSDVYIATIYEICNSKLNITGHEFIMDKIKNSSNSEPKKGALKYIKSSSSYGLESLAEMTIMSNFNHPNVNNTCFLQIDILGNISIIQDLAVGDASLIRKSSKKLYPEDLKSWIWGIVCGIAQLHSNGIFHGDIKDSNILLYYKDDNGLKINKKSKGLCKELSNIIVKLNDFSLSRVITDNNIGTTDSQKNMTFTSTHRPIEIWMKQKYSFSADMWALGCTIYEIVYGMILFPSQDYLNKNEERDANIKSFEYWNSLNITPQFIDFKIDIENDFRRPNISEHWVDPDNYIINDIILGLLDVDPKNRYTIWDVINHDYFEDKIVNEEYKNLLPDLRNRNFSNINYLKGDITESFIDGIKSYDINDDTAFLATSLYQRSRVSSVDVPQPSIESCIIVANKLIYRHPPKSLLSVTKKYLEDEINLCIKLNYKLLPHING